MMVGRGSMLGPKLLGRQVMVLFASQLSLVRKAHDVLDGFVGESKVLFDGHGF